MDEPKGIVRHIQTLQDPTLSRSYRGHQKATYCLSFDPSMHQLASGGADSIVYVYSFKPQGRAFKFNGHKGAVYSVQFSHDGQIIASGGEDRTIRLWKNSVMGKCQAIKGHIGSVRSLSFSPDNSMIVSSSDDKTIKGWNVLKTNFMFSLSGHTNWVRSSKLSPDARLVVSGSDDSTVRMWDVTNSKELYRFKDFKDSVYTVDWISDGTAICAGSADGKVKLWDVRSMRLIQFYDVSKQAVNSLNVHHSGNFIVTGDDENNVKLFDLRSGRLGWTLYSHKAQVKAVQFNDAGDYFGSAGLDQNVLVYKTNFDENIKLAWNVVNFIDPPEQSGNSGNSLGYSNQIQIPQTTFKANKQYNCPMQESQASASQNQQVTRQDQMAQLLSSRFDRIVSQMDNITNIIVRLDKRISNNEQNVQTLFQKENVKSLLNKLEEQYKEPFQQAAVWENYRNQQYQNIEQPEEEENQEPVFGTGSFMRDGLVEDYPEDSEKKLQQEYEEDKRDNQNLFTQTFNATNNPFQSGALANTLNQGTTFNLSVSNRLGDGQLNSLEQWRVQFQQDQQLLQQNQEDNENFIREVPDDEASDNEQQIIDENQQNQQGEQIEHQFEEQIQQEEYHDAQGNQGEEEQHLQDQGAQDQ
ncbi:hypothetical protein pb186bvf_001297 [Paramecium bursaria]